MRLAEATAAQEAHVIKLYGFPLSNYFNMVKAALLEKGIPFEVVLTRPSQEGEYLSRSPMGKVPCIETDAGFLSETQVILEYLEAVQPEPALLPEAPFERAKVRELVHALELYIELPARMCYPAAFFGAPANSRIQQQTQESLVKGVRAIRQLARFDPFIAGECLSLADLVALYSLPIADRVARTLWQGKVLEELPGAAAWLERMNERPAMKQIREDQRASLPPGV